MRLHRNSCCLNTSLNHQIDLAHISHLFFQMDSLIICDRAVEIYLYACEFLWLPLSVTSVVSTEPGPEAAMHAAVMMQPRRWRDEFCRFFRFGSVLATDERPATCGVSLYFCCINLPPMMSYDCFALGIWTLSETSVADSFAALICFFSNNGCNLPWIPTLLWLHFLLVDFENNYFFNVQCYTKFLIGWLDCNHQYYFFPILSS